MSIKEADRLIIAYGYYYNYYNYIIRVGNLNNINISSLILVKSK